MPNTLAVNTMNQQRNNYVPIQNGILTTHKENFNLLMLFDAVLL